MAVETFKAAKARLLAALEKDGWTVKRDLTYPWAKRREGRGDVQLWFKTQSIYMSSGIHLAMKEARSICSDFRGLTGAELERVVAYYLKM